MIIVSKFRDYYDNALMYGHDDSVRYIRKTDIVEHNNEKKWFSIYPEMKDYGYTQTPFYLGFCGKIYSGLRLQYGYKQFDRTFYDGVSLKEYISKIKSPWLRKVELDNFNRVFYSWRNQRRMSGMDICQEFFGVRDETELFFELGTPVFMVTRKELITNPDLSRLEFYRIFQAPQAFQEIDMYLSGVLGSAHPPMVEISDLSMRDKKGFNEWSFKKRPTKRL